MDDGIPCYEPTGFQVVEVIRRAKAKAPSWWRRLVRFWLVVILGF